MNTKTNKLLLVPILLSVVNLIISVIYILRLPEIVPTHFGVNWVCNGIGSRWTGIFLPVMTLVIPLIVPAVERLVASNQDRNQRVLQIVILMLCMFFMAMNWLILLEMGSGVGLGEQAESPNFGWLISLCIAFLFIGQGNYMPIIQQNRTLGIKIKYTLENEACWKLTHRFAGKLWVMSGIIYLLVILLAMLLHASQLLSFILLFVVMTINIVTPVIYAYQHKDAE